MLILTGVSRHAEISKLRQTCMQHTSNYWLKIQHMRNQEAREVCFH